MPQHFKVGGPIPQDAQVGQPIPAGSTIGDLPSEGGLEIPADLTLQAAPKPGSSREVIAQWAEQALSDLRTGGEQTGFGRLLKRMGAQGTQVGISPEAGEYVSSPVSGTLQTIQGVAQGDISTTLGGLASAAQLPLAMAGASPAASTAIGTKVLPRLVPSTVRAGQGFTKVSAAAGKLPVDVNAAGQVAFEAQKLAEAGATLPKVFRDFLKRATDPKQAALTFDEARQFLSNAGRLSADESSRMIPPMRRQISRFAAALQEAVKKTADSVGELDTYISSLKEYRRTAVLKSVAQAVKNKVLPLGLGGYILHLLYAAAKK